MMISIITLQEKEKRKMKMETTMSTITDQPFLAEILDFQMEVSLVQLSLKICTLVSQQLLVKSCLELNSSLEANWRSHLLLLDDVQQMPRVIFNQFQVSQRTLSSYEQAVVSPTAIVT